jgi:hypothetical protein
MTFTVRRDNHAGLLNATNGRPDAMSGLEDSTHCTDTDCISESWNILD